MSLTHIFLGASLLALAMSVHAGGLRVSPTHLKLDPGQVSTELHLSNESETAVSVQASVHRWQQSANGEDADSEAPELLIFPKVFRIEPGKSQLVRVGRQAGSEARPVKEIAYRVSLREIPVNDGSGSGVAVTTRLRLPLWLAPTQARNEWQMEAVAQERPVIRVSNRGTVHARLVSFDLTALDEAGATRGEAVVPGWYVLSGVAKDFPAAFPEGFCAPGITHIRAVGKTQQTSQEASWPADALCRANALHRKSEVTRAEKSSSRP